MYVCMCVCVCMYVIKIIFKFPTSAEKYSLLLYNLLTNGIYGHVYKNERLFADIGA